MYLGIDLSCYTTSCAIADDNGKIIYDGRRLLKVADGKCGLRQSEMVFEHIKNLKDIFPAGFSGVKAAAVSVKPRPLEGSYMPVFAEAETFGEVISKALGVPFYKLTHQHGHIGAALIGNIPADDEREREYIALHVSGGTTDVLKTHISKGIIKEITQLGEAKDISAGMFIDRIGVALGCGFPAGRELEKLAVGQPARLPSYVVDCCTGFSGAEAAAKRMIDQGVSKEEIASGVLRCVANSLEKLIRNASEETGLRGILLFGGVMCNGIIRERLVNRLPYRLMFADKAYSSDNACGLALQARNIDLRGKTDDQG